MMYLPLAHGGTSRQHKSNETEVETRWRKAAGSCPAPTVPPPLWVVRRETSLHWGELGARQ